MQNNKKIIYCGYKNRYKELDKVSEISNVPRLVSKAKTISNKALYIRLLIGKTAHETFNVVLSTARGTLIFSDTLKTIKKQKNSYKYLFI